MGLREWGGHPLCPPQPSPPAAAAPSHRSRVLFSREKIKQPASCGDGSPVCQKEPRSCPKKPWGSQSSPKSRAPSSALKSLKPPLLPEHPFTPHTPTMGSPQPCPKKPSHRFCATPSSSWHHRGDDWGRAPPPWTPPDFFSVPPMQVPACGPSSPCAQGHFCDEHFGLCLPTRPAGQYCRRDPHCAQGLLCMFGKCQQPVPHGQEGEQGGLGLWGGGDTRGRPPQNQP